ncbi:MAG: hypothetical protein DLM72_13685 [Candidatus Nitrosopolaris wilkensis]|nr:MAG: hypothetical protein DLM72_13685 [Candidatus Nitrosopolaris wilkensis]
MSLQVAKIKGIPIRLHFTLVIVSFLTAWAFAAMLMPEIYPGLNISVYWIMGIIGAIILLVSVLLPELAHSIVALRYGLKVREIILFIFGGVSVIEDQDEEASSDFRKEFKIAVVGPITSFVIAAILATSLCLLIYVTTGSNNNKRINNTDNIPAIIVAGVLQYGALVNVLLGGINPIPAFPSDGGRILRSALLRSKRDYDKSTKITSSTTIKTCFQEDLSILYSIVVPNNIDVTCVCGYVSQILYFFNSAIFDLRNTSAPSNPSTSDFGILYSPRAPSVMITMASVSMASTFPTSALSFDLTFLWTIASQSTTGESDILLLHMSIKHI